jgi:predicted extracellular nuclease
MLRSLPFISAIFLITAAFGFRSALAPKPSLSVVFYNVENLFDTIDTPNVQDEDFTPTGKLKWDSKRYQKKLTDLAKVLSEASGEELPSAIGLCEVENRAVVEDLFRSKRLAKTGYKIVHSDSPDERGIDVAFAYNTRVMKHIYEESIPVKFDFDTAERTRDILYVKTVASGDTLHFFVNHWPSRNGGQEKSEPKRIVAAQVLKAKIDVLKKRDAGAKIIVMGDFNDYPDNRTMTEVLNSVPSTRSGLSNLTYRLHASGVGSYNYKGDWGMLDQFIVSDGLLSAKAGWTTTDTAATVYSAEHLLYTDKESGKASPSKTYGGPNYYGGYSDHLPIVLRLHRVGKK